VVRLAPAPVRCQTAHRKLGGPGHSSSRSGHPKKPYRVLFSVSTLTFGTECSGAEAAVKGAGGRLEALYFAFGETDGFAILDLPDNASAAALALAISASGAGSAKTTVLLTPEEIDTATKKTISYRAPGQ